MKLIYKIIKQSILVLIFAAIISSLGGISLMNITDKLTALLPLIILIPALNDMVGDFGIIIVSRFTTHLYERKSRKFKLHLGFIKHLTKDILFIAILSAIYIAVLASAVAFFKGSPVSIESLLKIVLISVIVTLFIIFLLFLIAIFGGFLVYKKNEDPDNILIPITTAIADLGSLILFSILVRFFF